MATREKEVTGGAPPVGRSEAWAAANPRSKSLSQRAARVLPGGVTHDVRQAAPFPLAVARAEGSHKWDLDGHEIVCYVMGHGAAARRAAAMTSLAVVGGRVVDPGQGIDDRLGVAIADGRVAALGEAAPAAETVDASGLVLVPGLVDLHTHLYQGVSHYGIDPDANCLRRGVTTAVDAGSAGAQTFPGFRRYVIECATTRVLAFLHVAVQGMMLIWDPGAGMTIAAATFDNGTGDSVYAGERLSGRVRDVLLRGRALARHGRYVAEGAGGTYLNGRGG